MTTMATARPATKSTMMAMARRTMRDNDDDDNNVDGMTKG